MSAAKPLVCVVDSQAWPLLTEVEVEREIFAGVAEVELVPLDNPEPLPDALREADGVIVAAVPRISRQTLNLMPRARIIVRNGVGYDNVDAEAARELGIVVANVPDYCTEEVADHTLALALALERRLLAAVADVRSGHWTWKIGISARRLRGRVFGIVGCGRIGTAVALRAKAFGYRVGYHDPYLPSGHERALGVVRFAALSDLLEAADVVSLHTPLTPETRGLIGAGEMARIKPGALLINTARGPLIQEQAVLAALKAGRLRGLALDVLEREPVFEPELGAHPSCLITPHMAFYSDESARESRVFAAQTVRDVLKGLPPRNVVNGVTEPRRAPDLAR
jgi:phosphoglycerate dehydrogenase-like enzyme